LGQGRKHVWFCGAIITIFCLWVAAHLSAAPQNNSKTKEPPASASRPDILFVQTPSFVSGPLTERFPKGSRIVLLKAASASNAPISLTDGFFAAADPQVNFEATKILFSAQKSQKDHWQLWEMDLNGANKHQVTQCEAGCLRGAYLPAGEMVLTVESPNGDSPAYLAVVKADGSQLRRITFGSAGFQLETVLRDGRIVASAPWPLYQDTNTRILYTLRPDGTALESLRCDHKNDAIQTDAEELNDGTILFVHAKEKASTAELMRLQRGLEVPTPLGPRNLTYESARQLSSNELVTASTGASDSQPKFDLYVLQTKSGTLRERVFSDPKLSSVQPLPVLPHDVPKRFWSTLNPESETGYFISLNSYLSGDAPKGRIDKAIANVRVLTLNAVDGRERTLGEAPVESDGSFYVRVPANTPIRFILLDKNGAFIHEERGWVWTRPGEQRGCTGCHGDKNAAPENHWPMTLKRFDTPTPLGETEHAPATSTAK
jgi:hydrazine synthase alpha subunit-like protein